MDIIDNIKNILKLFSFCLVAIVFCVSATEVAHAKTISNNFTYLDSSRLDFFENIFLRSNYTSYLLAAEVTTSGYSSYTYYYYCLSNEQIDTSNVLSTALNCDEIYRYYRNSSNDYIIEKLNDSELKVNNSIYYANSVETKGLPLKAYLLAINIGIFCIFLIIVLFKLFGV